MEKEKVECISGSSLYIYIYIYIYFNIVLTWKIIGVSEVSVIYIYILVTDLRLDPVP